MIVGCLLWFDCVSAFAGLICLCGFDFWGVADCLGSDFRWYWFVGVLVVCYVVVLAVVIGLL